MRSFEECPICSGSARFVQSAFLSPWIREFANVSRRRSNYFICSTCGSGHFDYRYSDDEMSRIYGNYRSTEYFRIRSKWEPSYTEALDFALSTDPETIERRQFYILESLAQVDASYQFKVRNVIDVGGDRGQFMPSLFPNRWVLDISNKELVPGVERISTLEEAKELKPDLVLSMGILEHVPEPKKLIEQLSELGSSDKSTYVYIEVPSGVPQRRSRVIQLVAIFIATLAHRNAKLWSCLDLLATRHRLKKHRPSLILPLRQSEHINFFTKDGLQKCVQDLGLTLCVLDEVDLPIGLSTQNLQFSRLIRLLVRVS